MDRVAKVRISCLYGTTERNMDCLDPPAALGLAGPADNEPEK